MSRVFTWRVQDRLGPIVSSGFAEILGLSLAPSILVGYHVAAHLDINGLVDQFTVFDSHSGWDNFFADVLHNAGSRFAHKPTCSFIFYSRRIHDIIDEHDEEDVHYMAAWLASEDIRLLDWYVMTDRSVRSIPADFGIPRHW